MRSTYSASPTAITYKPLSVYLSPLIIEVGDVLSYVRALNKKCELWLTILQSWTVPFAPGTQYQICMFDKFGNTGGCQATYTVIPPTSTPTCGNVTFPPQLGVAAVVDNGPMSQYGWVDQVSARSFFINIFLTRPRQCTDIQLTPTNGTAPFTLTASQLAARHVMHSSRSDRRNAL